MLNKTEKKIEDGQEKAYQQKIYNLTKKKGLPTLHEIGVNMRGLSSFLSTCESGPNTHILVLLPFTE